ncbi:MAG TPA: HlyD family efflux transporter periplasmic adaptor subunit [Candidatus Elarobacter sp.]|nr:HlyD family efflux transporter periplasmic adaptor subunit [Candidatus Elarobacter sp.]
MRRTLYIALLFALSACTSHEDFTYSGTLQADSAAVGSTVGGRVARVLVSDGAAVRAGDVVLRFDDAQERAALSSAVARLGQSRAALADLRAGARPEDLARAAALVDQQRAQYEAAQSTRPYQTAVNRDAVRQAAAQLSDANATAVQAHADADRMRSLYATGDVSGQQRDAAVARETQAYAQVAGRRAAVRAARAQAGNAARVTLPQNAAAALAAYRAAQEQYDALAAGPRPDQLRQAESALRGAQADIVAARARLAETVVRAPAAGAVSALELHPGDLVAPGASIATIDEAGSPYARVYVPQEKLGRVGVGAHVDVQADSLPGERFDGTVEQVDAQAQFTPQNVQTAGDRAVLSFGVKVRVADPRHQLHAGTTVAVALP